MSKLIPKAQEGIKSKKLPEVVISADPWYLSSQLRLLLTDNGLTSEQIELINSDLKDRYAKLAFYNTSGLTPELYKAKIQKYSFDSPQNSTLINIGRKTDLGCAPGMTRSLINTMYFPNQNFGIYAHEAGHMIDDLFGRSDYEQELLDAAYPRENMNFSNYFMKGWYLPRTLELRAINGELRVKLKSLGYDNVDDVPDDVLLRLLSYLQYLENSQYRGDNLKHKKKADRLRNSPLKHLTRNHYKRYKKKLRNELDKANKMTDEEIKIWLDNVRKAVKEVALNDNKTELNIAKQGMKIIPRKQTGGPVNSEESIYQGRQLPEATVTASRTGEAKRVYDLYKKQGYGDSDASNLTSTYLSRVGRVRNREDYPLGEATITTLEMVPGIGDVFALGYEPLRTYLTGNSGKAVAGSLAMAAAGFIPGGSESRLVTKAELSAAKKAEKAKRTLLLANRKVKGEARASRETGKVVAVREATPWEKETKPTVRLILEKRDLQADNRYDALIEILGLDGNTMTSLLFENALRKHAFNGYYMGWENYPYKEIADVIRQQLKAKGK